MNVQRDIVQAARDIRPYLPALLPTPQADAMQEQLEQILTATNPGETEKQALANLLSPPDATREWLRLYLEEGHRAEEILPLVRTYHPLPGKEGAIASPRYCCPIANCHLDWYRRDVTETIPDCPIHGVQMIRDSKVQAP